MNETILISYMMKNPAESYGIMDRVAKVEPDHIGYAQLFACIRVLLENGIPPAPGVLDNFITKIEPGLDKQERKKLSQALATAATLPAPNRDEAELAILRLIEEQKSRVLQNAMLRVQSNIEEQKIAEAEAAIAEAGAQLSELDYDSMAAAIGADEYDYYGYDPGDLGERTGFGIHQVDEKLKGGGRRKDFLLVAGYAKQGKSILCRQVANLARLQGKNGVIFTLEDTVDEVLCSLLTNHSHLHISSGLEYDDVESRGEGLGREGTAALKKTVDDWQNNKDYGKLEIIEPRDDGTILTVAQKLMEYRRKWGRLDYVIVDYLQNLKPVNPRDEARLKIAETMRIARNISMRFHHGEGIYFLSPHPVKQASYDKAMKELYYDFTALRETAEAGAKLTAMLWILITPELREANKAKIGIAAQRKGELGPKKGWTVSAMLGRRKIAALQNQPTLAEEEEMQQGGAE